MRLLFQVRDEVYNHLSALKNRTTMNEQNLISMTERTTSERQEIARKGGIASGEARREKKLAKQIAIDILNEKVVANGKEQTMKEVMIARYITQTTKKPTQKDIDFILALIGEEVVRKTTHEIEGVQISDEDKKRFEEVFGMGIK
jgi:hypothetical protein